MDVGDADAVDAAFESMRAGFDYLVKLVEHGGLETRDAVGLVGFAQEFERFRNRLALVDHQIVRDAQRRDLASSLPQPSLVAALAATLRVSVREAARRVRAADAVAERTSMLGEPLEPVRPQLAAAQRSGDVSPDQVDIIERALAKVSGRGFDPADVDWGEQHLAQTARTFGPRELKRLADQVVDGIDPDGTLPDDKLQQDRRHFDLRPVRGGGWVGEFRLTGECGSKLHALLSPLAAPRVNPAVTADGIPVVEGRRDERSHPQRMHDALEDVCDRLLRAGSPSHPTAGAGSPSPSHPTAGAGDPATDAPATDAPAPDAGAAGAGGSVPDWGGTPATVILTFDLEDLLDRTGYAVASDGTLVPTEKALALADAADVYFAAVTARGQVLNLGRQRRIANRPQTVALIARDVGCSFPGCDAAPEWCERHHIIAWFDGGRTDLDNLTLLCRYHHHNFLARGWDCTINSDGLPEWSPPAWLDPHRRPLINNRILGRIAATTARRRQ